MRSPAATSSRRVQVGDYDRTRPLVIDPVLVYATYLGGSLADAGRRIAVDAAGNAYVTGATSSADFPTTAGALATTSTRPEAFVTKLNPAGTALLYSTYLGGSGADDGFDIAVDAAGNAYVTGITNSPDFPTTAGAFQATLAGGFFGDAFVTKLNPTGSALVYSTYLGGTGANQGRGIAVDTAGSAYVTGRTESADFPTTAGAFDTTPNDTAFGDAFVTKLNPAGSDLVYSTYLGGIGSDQGLGVALDAAGHAYVVGFTNSSDFPTTPGSHDRVLNNGVGFNADAFVTKLDPTGSALIYSTYLGGRSDDTGLAIAVDAASSAYVTGGTQSDDFPTTFGAFDGVLGGNQDAFITKLDPAGAMLVYSTFLGGSFPDLGSDIKVDGAGRAHVTGNTGSVNFPTTADAFQATLAGGFSSDAFVTILDPTGTLLVYSTYLGGTGGDFGHGIALDAAGNTYVVGFTESADFPVTAGAFDTTLGGLSDAFVAKIGENVAPPPDTTPPTITITTPPNGAVYARGQVVLADYVCEDDSGVVLSCTGNVPDGAPIDTAMAGAKTFTVTAQDAAGNMASLTHEYTVCAKLKDKKKGADKCK